MRPRRISDMSTGYWQSASHQSMAVYLKDAEDDLMRLTKLRDRLASAHAERLAEAERGDWPPPPAPAAHLAPPTHTAATQARDETTA